MTSPRPIPAPNVEALEARFALRATSHLTARSQDLPQDITERLRVAREQALERARAVRAEAAPEAASVHAGSTLTWPGEGRAGDEGTGWWVKLGAILPFVALIAGLLLIQDWHGANQVSAAAEIDASLLADDLPPSAYSDEGFLEYLNSQQD